MAEWRPILDIMARSFCSAEEFRAGWEGWLEGARLAQLRFDVEDMVRVVSCARSGTDSWFWWRRGISLVQDLGIAMVGLSSFLGIIILVGWFICIPSMRGSLILQGFFLALIWFLEVALPLMIRQADIAVGWMLAIGGFSAGRSCCLRLLSIKVWRVS